MSPAAAARKPCARFLPVSLSVHSTRGAQTNKETGLASRLVWPGIHRAIAQRYLSDPAKYEWVEQLAPCCAELAKELGILPVTATMILLFIISVVATTTTTIICLSITF